jgi:hypothetical protein
MALNSEGDDVNRAEEASGDAPVHPGPEDLGHGEY